MARHTYDRPMLATVFSRAAFGVCMVGHPEAAVKESKDRVRSAITTSGFQWPPGRITLNLSPADRPKDGGRFDLPIALGVLAATCQLPSHVLIPYEFYGELSLAGELRAVRGIVSAVCQATLEQHPAHGTA
jgi:magnesium chelatase family protein